MPGTMSDENTIDPNEPMLVAGEYVLGVLSAAERKAFDARLAREPELRRQVEYWEQRLGGLAAEIRPVDPPPHVWANVQAALAGRPARNRLWSNLVFWRWAAFGSATLAAASLAVLMVAIRGPAPNTPLVAKLEGKRWTSKFRGVSRFGRRRADYCPGLRTECERARSRTLADRAGRSPPLARPDRARAGSPHQFGRWLEIAPHRSSSAGDFA